MKYLRNVQSTSAKRKLEVSSSRRDGIIQKNIVVGVLPLLPLLLLHLSLALVLFFFSLTPREREILLSRYSRARASLSLTSRLSLQRRCVSHSRFSFADFTERPHSIVIIAPRAPARTYTRGNSSLDQHRRRRSLKRHSGTTRSRFHVNSLPFAIHVRRFFRRTATTAANQLFLCVTRPTRFSWELRHSSQENPPGSVFVRQRKIFRKVPIKARTSCAVVVVAAGRGFTPRRTTKPDARARARGELQLLAAGRS